VRLPETQAQGDVPMRVLVFQGVDRVEVSGAPEGDVAIVAVPGDGLQVAGGGVESSWRSRVSEDPLEVRAAGRTVQVRGRLEVLALYGPEAEALGALQGLAVVNELPLDRYLAGTLAAEMYGSWGEAALAAQAVASRTYALYRRGLRSGAAWHLSAGTRSQVYQGVSAESEPVEKALADTRGEILVYNDAPILAAFHSSSGGQTASAEEVWGEARDYLVSVPVEDEWDSPDAYWRARVTRGTLARAVEGLGEQTGPVTAVKIVARTESGRVARVALEGESGKAILTGRQLRSALGESVLKSTLFELREDGDAIVFVGSGRGHGVGMSQWGARAMARRGASYRVILGTFYPGAEIAYLKGSRKGGNR
jgi:stage II sporulation protein D